MMRPQLQAQESLAVVHGDKDGPVDVSAQVASLNEHVLELAAQQKWQEAAEVVARRDALLTRIPVETRKRALLASRECTLRLTVLAEAARSCCAGQLSALRQGRKAAESYSACR